MNVVLDQTKYSPKHHSNVDFCKHEQDGAKSKTWLKILYTKTEGNQICVENWVSSFYTGGFLTQLKNIW